MVVELLGIVVNRALDDCISADELANIDPKGVRIVPFEVSGTLPSYWEHLDLEELTSLEFWKTRFQIIQIHQRLECVVYVLCNFIALLFGFRMDCGEYETPGGSG